MITAWKNSQKAEGVDEIFYPGEKEERHHLNAITEGLALADDTLDRLISFAHNLGISITLDDLLIQE